MHTRRVIYLPEFETHIDPKGFLIRTINGMREDVLLKIHETYIKLIGNYLEIELRTILP